MSPTCSRCATRSSNSTQRANFCRVTTRRGSAASAICSRRTAIRDAWKFRKTCYEKSRGRTLKFLRGRCAGAHLIRALLFEHDENARQQLATNRTDDRVVMFAFGPLAFVIGLQFGVVLTRHKRRQPESPAQIR